jgi:hypothetical protein
MNKQYHLAIGIIILVAYSIICSKLSLTPNIFYASAVLLGAILPDILDPWSLKERFDHRKVWHSTNLIKPLGIILVISFVIAIFSLKGLIGIFFSLGYLSHLGADSKFIGFNIMGKDLSRGLPTYPTFLAGLKERYIR